MNIRVYFKTSTHSELGLHPEFGKTKQAPEMFDSDLGEEFFVVNSLYGGPWII